MYGDLLTQNVAWQMVIYAMAVVFPAVLLLEVYSSIRHRITHGVWPKTRNEWSADEVDSDLQRMMDEANPAIPGTATYESRLEMEMSRSMEEAYRNMNPL